MSDRKQPLELVEPTFVLRASDPLAPSLIRQWARRCELALAKNQAIGLDADDIKRARRLALDMETWSENDLVRRHAAAHDKFSQRFGTKSADVIKLSSRRPQ